MTILALFRHAEALQDHAGGDHARPLSEAGRHAAEAAGHRLRMLLPPTVLVVASDARRTRETANLAFPPHLASHVQLEPALYAAVPDDLLALVHGLAVEVPAVVLVGHNPGISELAALLAGKGVTADLARVAQGLAPAEAVVFDFETDWAGIAPDGGRLTALLVGKLAED